ncbi:hypothetical protein [Aminipila sp.]|uniref:hypothetical protein n=1 Tax=Aminipila sp. TaxID=2060095 RepID=UPI00289D318B|nr:hypothetical protein [Aminipila sp.]
MSYTKCELFVDALAEEVLNISPKNHERFCFKPNKIFKDDLGITSTGKLVILSEGDYRITASANIYGGAANDFVHFGFDTLGRDGETGAGKYYDYLQTTVKCDSSGNGAQIFGNVSDVAHFTAGQVIGCIYLRGNENTVNIKACCPMMTIEKIG